MSIFIRALVIPFIILCLTSIPLMLTSATSIPFATNPEPPIPFYFSPWLGLTQFLGTLLMIWIVNTCYRITIQGKAGFKWWTMRETWTLIWMFLLGILTTVGSMIPAMVIFFLLTTFNMQMAGMITAAITYSLILSYLLGRLCIIFPSIAVGERMSLEQTWKMSENNGWRIIILLGLLPMIPVFAGFVMIAIIASLLPALSIQLPESLFVLSSLIVGFAVVSISSTALGLVYKQLK
ncbi:MAG: hypothetical protein ACHQAX_01610 [Gammaproteobacteria bacterium]